jgi:hypothetical protein
MRRACPDALVVGERVLTGLQRHVHRRYATASAPLCQRQRAQQRSWTQRPGIAWNGARELRQ